MAYLGHAIGQDLSEARAKVYFDLLGDMSAVVLLCAVKRVALEHPWPSFPSPAEIRQAAAATAQGPVAGLTAGEAWEMAWQAVKNIDLEIPSTFERATSRLPALVLKTMRAFGLVAMISGQEPVKFIRERWLKMYGELAAVDKKERLYPPQLKQEIAAIGQTHMSAMIRPVINKIGKME